MNPFGKKSAASFEIDLSDVPESGFYVEPGEYGVKVIGCEKGMSKAGKPMITWEVALLDGPRPGMQLKTWTVLTPEAMWKVADFFEALGVGKRGDKLTIDPTKIIGRRAIAVVQDDEYNGKTVSRLQSLLAHPEGPVMPKPTAPGVKAPKDLGAKPKQEETPEAEDDGDIPF